MLIAVVVKVFNSLGYSIVCRVFGGDAVMCGLCSLEHEEQVWVPLSSATVEVAKVGCVGDVVDN